MIQPDVFSIANYAKQVVAIIREKGPPNYVKHAALVLAEKLAKALKSLDSTVRQQLRSSQMFDQALAYLHDFVEKELLIDYCKTGSVDKNNVLYTFRKQLLSLR